MNSQDRVDSYGSGWAAMGWLLRQGLSWSGRERNVSFLGLGDGTFLETSGAMGLDLPDDGRSVAQIDWDHDGDLDWIVRARTTPRLRFLENRLPRRGQWIEAKPVGVAGAIGARLEVRAKGRTTPWLRTARAGEGYLSQSSEWLHVGLGDQTQVELSVVWPGGTREAFGEVATGQRYLLVQGEGRARESSPPSSQALEKTQEPLGERFGSKGRHVLAVPHPLPSLLVESGTKQATLGGILAQRQGRTQKPVFLMLWSRDCMPCVAERGEWASQRKAITESGLGVLALELPLDPGSTDSIAPSSDWPYASATCPEASANLLHALACYFTDSTLPLAVPMGFLIDGKGRIQVLYWGAASVEEVLGDRALFDLSGPERLRAALPFDGLYWEPPSEPDWNRWAGVLRARDLPEVAAEVEWGLISTTDVQGPEAQYQIGQARLRQGRLEDALPHLTQAVEAAPRIARYLEALGQCLHGLGRSAEAQTYYERALVAQPRNSMVLYSLGSLQSSAGEVSAARRTLGTLRPLDPDLAERLRLQIEAKEAESK
ncbi:MAG: ASPIC/UnbV domain-containing protein [Planctomycetes bacterium]|nr:ASPIC/UnbV domain-containing protein [Planctomycetota bacterium]